MSEYSSKHNGSRTSIRKHRQTSKVSKSSSQKSTSSKSTTKFPEIETEVTYSFFSEPPERKPTLSDYKRKSLKEKPLFPTVVTLDSNDALLERKTDTSFLVKGFGMRNLESFQNALRIEEEKRLLQLYKYQQKQLEEERLRAVAEPVSTSPFTSSTSSETVPEVIRPSQTTTTSSSSTTSGRNLHLEYLMGLQTFVAEEETPFTKPEQKEEEDVFVYSTSAPMRNSQKYLRAHRIFDFFQFIIAQLLGASPENPIGFILELLNKCLLYRSGMGVPPLLYDKKHITQLFCLMDRMGSGFVDLEQYNTGMGTLGICEYNKYPVTTDDGLVDKDTFVEEVYDAELALFQDLIGRKWMKKPARKLTEDKEVNEDVSRDDSVPYFLPPELFKSYRIEKEMEKEKEKAKERERKKLVDLQEEEEFFGE